MKLNISKNSFENKDFHIFSFPGDLDEPIV